MSKIVELTVRYVEDGKPIMEYSAGCLAEADTVKQLFKIAKQDIDHYI